MKRIMLAIVIVVAATLGVAIPTARADTDTLRIKVDGSQGYEFEVTTDQSVVIFWRWVVCPRGQDQAFLRAVNENYHELDSTALFTSLEDANQHWGPIQPLGIFPGVCKGGDILWVTFWEYDLGQLSLGTHNLHSSAGLAHRLTDPGGNIDPGKPPFYNGNLFVSDITITVVAAGP